MRTLLLILFLFIFELSDAQNFSNLKIEKSAHSDTIKLHYGFVVPQTINLSVKGKNIDKKHWFFDAKKNEICLDTLFQDTVVVKYRIINIKTYYSYYDTSLIVPSVDKNNERKVYASKIEEELDQTSDIVKQGEILRGISIGNNQDAVLNSALNLQISGKLNNDLKIEAQVSDRTLPFQPDGSTAKIQDFNKAFIKVYNEKSALTAGDIDIHSEARFLRYHKQIKGLAYKTIFNNDTISAGVALSKGNFRRQYIQGIEGNQGPYKLSGANGEAFILVLSASEKVYLDGKLLKRGENFDYTIDYNMAELTFTANKPITKDSRIIVEFEYYNRNYNRFAFFTNSKIKTKKGNFYLNFYEEKDAKNQPVNLEMSDSLKEFLYNAGDDANKMLINNAIPTVFNADKILYVKKDTVVKGIAYQIYEYSQDKNKKLYDVKFSYAGKNSGNYVIDNSNINGRVYRWIAPIDGVPQGEYSAVTHLVAPEKHTVAEFGGNMNLSVADKLNLVVSASNTDKNLFSPFDDDDNAGIATSVNFVHRLKNNSAMSFTMRYVGDRYNALETFRPQEFFRNWNVDTIYNSGEIYGKMQYSFNKTKTSGNFAFSLLNYSDKYTGVKAAMNINRVGDRLNYTADGFLLHTIASGYVSDFAKSNFISAYNWGKYSTGLLYEQETNFFRQKPNIFLKNSYMYHSAGFFFKKSDTLNNPFEIAYKRRWDFVPQQKMILADYSDNISFVSNVRKKRYSSSTLLNYRTLSVIDTSVTENKADNFLTGREILSFNILKGALNSNFSAQLSSGMEQKREFIYVETKPGMGNYRWVDYNSDGIKQIDEFEPAYYSDQAKYMRVNIQTNEYVRVFDKQISSSLKFSPAKLFSDNSKIGKALFGVNNLSSLIYAFRGGDSTLFVFDKKLAVRYNATFNDILSINFFQGMTLKYNFYVNNSKNIIISGTDEMRKKYNKFIFNYKWRAFLLSDEFKIEQNIQQTDYSIFKNYYLKGNQNNISFLCTKNNTQFSISYLYSDFSDVTGIERNIKNSIELTYGYSVNEGLKVELQINAIDNNFKGNEGTAAGFVLLEGLHNGRNYTWNLTLKKKLFEYLNLQLIYSGRYSEGNKIIHTGTFNVVAFL